jgi:hypothetical protein
MKWEWRYSSTILDLSTNGVERQASRLCSFTPGYPLDRRLGGPQNRSERYGEKKNLAVLLVTTSKCVLHYGVRHMQSSLLF